jgi:hypothetical protein
MNHKQKEEKIKVQAIENLLNKIKQTILQVLVK